jgi:LuxR family transcriptional regulator, maltose regulon positive regulatory protein
MAMPIPRLETKLFIPGARRELVPRPRLIERMAHGTAGKLLLVSAPAGFGKSTLLASWATDPSNEGRCSWLSLDPSDDEPRAFWSYVIAALQTVAPRVGEGALTLLDASPLPAFRSVLTSLLNDLSGLQDDVTLVLDDYHVIASREVQDSMTFLVEHLPPRLHLVIATRADPALPLARMRARGELVELRASDLRFTPAEAATYLNEVAGLRLSSQSVTALEGKTEGWIAALQLAALSMEGRDDVAGFITGFTGDDRYVVDYLVEEVVSRQSPDVRDFLLQTSVLRRLNGSLCDAVTGRSDGREVLESLERGNMFLVPLDDHRRWYRYHHLFADVLRTRLLEEQPDLVPGLHTRASAWHAEHGETAIAVDHAFAASDPDRAAELVELATPTMLRDRREATLLSWLQRLPDDVVRRRPVLCISYAATLLSTNHVEGVESRLQDAERWLPLPHDEEAAPYEAVVADEAELRRLPGAVAVYRAGLAMALGDTETTAFHARRAGTLLPEDDHLGHASAAALIGLASWAGGDLEAAHDAYTECTEKLTRAGHLADVLGCAVTLADIRITQGRLRDAMGTYEQALQVGPAAGGPAMRGTPDMYVGMSSLSIELGDLEAAARLLARSNEMGEHLGLPQHPYRRCVTTARLRMAEGDLDSAVHLLDEADRLYVGDFLPNVRPVPASRARAWIAQGRLDDAFDWARERGLSIDDDLSYLREFEHVTLARALLAGCRVKRDKRSVDEVMGFLGRLLAAADEGGRSGIVVEILVLQSLAHQLREGIPAAITPLARALELAEPEGYLRIFVDEGAPMATLLSGAAKHRISAGYVRRLREALRVTRAPSTPQGLIDPLSERELDVLRLLGSELSGPDIAGELTLSLNTVRTHTKNVYAKLGVTSRRAAVRRATELDLMSRTGHRRT